MLPVPMCYCAAPLIRIKIRVSSLRYVQIDTINMKMERLLCDYLLFSYFNYKKQRQFECKISDGIW